MRIDQYLVEQQYFPTRSKAQDAIAQERVKINGTIVKKNSMAIKEADSIEVETAAIEFVSRAGFKLYDVVEDFQIQLQDRICMDIGASTGGFSDVCLQQGAKLVYALDVGKDQLDPSLRDHPRIDCREQLNCRYLERDLFQILPDFACMDVSFISIKLILPAIQRVMQDVELVALIKPQFEAGKEWIGKNGIIKDKKVHLQVLSDMISYVESLNLFVHHLQASSILGRDGNKEFVMHIKSTPCAKKFDLKKIVEESRVKR